VVVARFALDGRVLEENSGFARLHDKAELRPWQLFTRPRFDELTAMAPDSKARIYAGKLTVGDPEGAAMRTLIGSVYCDGDEMLVVAGYDVFELEQMSDVLLDLNRQLDVAHRELVQAHRELGKREATARQVSLTDSLTGGGNRRKFDDNFPVEVEQAHRHGYPLSVVMLDLDHFKSYNDTLGHEAGDRALREVGLMLGQALRQTDGFYRIGGEEFVIAMPATDSAHAVDAAQRLRRILEARPLEKTVTASLGVATLAAGESGSQLLARADAAMYRAKQNGRNRVET